MTLDATIKTAIAPIMAVIERKIEEGNYMVSVELNGALTFILIGKHRFSYFDQGVQIFSGFEPIKVSELALQILEGRIRRQEDTSDRLAYEALKAKFEGVN